MSKQSTLFDVLKDAPRGSVVSEEDMFRSLAKSGTITAVYAPHVRGSITSKAAADAVRYKAPTQAAIVLSLLAGAGASGMTDGEIAEATAEYGWTPDDHRRARRGLVKAGTAGPRPNAPYTRSSSRGHQMTIWISSEFSKEKP